MSDNNQNKNSFSKKYLAKHGVNLQQIIQTADCSAKRSMTSNNLSF